MESAFLALFLQSLLVGVAIVAPVGPIAQAVIQRTLQRGRWQGLSCGLGVAVGDAAYGALGAFGVAALIRLVDPLRLPLAVGGGVFLLWLAWQTWRRVPAGRAATPGGDDAPAGFATSLRLTLAHPVIVLAFMAVFGAWAGRGVPASPWALVLGVLVGSVAWWLLLSLLVARLRARFDRDAQRWINRGAALVLASFAMWQWASLLAASPDVAAHPFENLVADWWPSA